MKNNESKLVMRFVHEEDGLAVYGDGPVTIEELKAAIEALQVWLDGLLDMQEREFLKQMDMAFKDMVKGGNE